MRRFQFRLEPKEREDEGSRELMLLACGLGLVPSSGPKMWRSGLMPLIIRC